MLYNMCTHVLPDMHIPIPRKFGCTYQADHPCLLQPLNAYDYTLLEHINIPCCWVFIATYLCTVNS